MKKDMKVNVERERRTYNLCKKEKCQIIFTYLKYLQSINGQDKQQNIKIKINIKMKKDMKVNRREREREKNL